MNPDQFWASHDGQILTVKNKDECSVALTLAFHPTLHPTLLAVASAIPIIPRAGRAAVLLRLAHEPAEAERVRMTGRCDTHGQSVLHWQRDQNGRLCLNLEDAWDAAASADSFVAHLRTSSRRKIVLTRWRKQRWVVEPFVPAIVSTAPA